MVEETTICLQCGDRGYENAFVYCVRCLNFAVHRYCLDVLPDSFDEFVSWLCDDCKCNLKERKQSGILDHDDILSQTSHHEVPNNITGFSGNGNKKIDLVVAETRSDLVECGELSSQPTPTPIEFPAGCLTQEKTGFRIKIKFKKRENTIRESSTEKDQDRLATASYDECLKVDANGCTRLASDSSLPSNVKEVFQQKDQTSLSKHFDSVTDHGISGVPADHFVISSNGPSRCSIKDVNAILLPEDVNKRSQLQEENVEGNLIEQKRRIKITFKRRGKKVSEFTTEKDQGRLSTACNDECSKVDIIECTRSANDSTLSSEVKEDVFFEQKDQLCISKPVDAITDLDIAGVPADHPGISSNGPSVGLKNDGNGIILPADVSNRSQLDEEKVEGNMTEPIELSAGCMKQKNERNNMGSTTEKDQHTLATASYDERVEVNINESPRSASGSTLLPKVKVNKCSEQKDETFVSKPIDSTIDLCIAVLPSDSPVIDGSSTRLKNDGNGILLPEDVSKGSQLQEEKIDGNLIEPIALSTGCLKRKKKKRKKNIMESTSVKDQHGLATASYAECVKEDIKECSRSAHDSTLPSKVKENQFCEQKDQTCISKPVDSTTDLGIAVVSEGHPVIPNNGSSMSLKNDGNDILLPADVSKRSQFEKEQIEGNLIEPIELSAGCPKRKKKKKRKRTIMESTAEKDQHGLAATSYDERVKADITECTRSASDSTLPSKVKESKCSEQKERMCVSKPIDSTKRSQLEEENIVGNLIEPIDLSAGFLKRKKKKRNRTLLESTAEKDQPRLATTSFDEHVIVDINEFTRSESDSTLPSKVKENKCSEQKEHMCVSKPFDSAKRSHQLEEENIDGNLIEPIGVSAGCLKQKKKKKRKRKSLDSTAQKDQLGLATTSYDARVKVDLTECSRSARYSALPYEVKENKCCEQKDHTCVSKPFDSTKRSQLEEEKIEGNLIEPIDLSAGGLKRKKKKKIKRTSVESTAEKDQHGLATASYDEHVKVDLTECAKSASDPTLPYKVKENKCCEQKDHMCVSKPFDSTKRSQLEEENIEGNLMVPIDLSAGCLKQKKKKKRKRTVMESTAEKDHHGLATASYDEHVKVDLTECAKSASDPTLPYKVKENICCGQKDHMCVSKPFDSTKRSQLEEENIEGNLIEPIDLSAGCLKRKKKKKRKITIMESTAEKDQHGLATSSYDERVKVDLTECARSPSDSTLPYKVKENKCCEQIDQMCVSKPSDSTKRSQLEEEEIEGNLIEPIVLSAGCLKRKKKKKRKRTIMESTAEKDQHGLATTSYDERVKVDLTECARSASDSTLPYKVKENKCCEQIDQKCVSKPSDSTKRSQLEEEEIEGNLIEPIDLSAGCLKRKKKKKRKRTIMESTAEKDQHGLATTSYDERVKVDLTECARSASDSTLPYKVKENKCCEQKDQMCVSKPSDSTKQSQLEEDETEGNLIEPIDLSAGCLKRKKRKKRKRTIMESIAEKDQHGLATTSYDKRVKVDFTDCTRSASDSTLPSMVKENKCAEQKNCMCVSKPCDSAKLSQLEEKRIEGSLIEPIDLSAGCLKLKKKKKKKRNIMETTTEKDQHRLATTLYDERVKVEISECTRSARECPQQKDHMFVSKPFDSLTDLGISDVPADHHVTSSNFVQPVAVPVWRGSFSIWNGNYDNIDLLVAHISNKACHKVYEATSQLQPVVRLEMRPKSDLWPTSFQTAKPNGDNIALYFLPSKTSEQAYEQLVGEMMHKELAFRAFVQNAELLIFTSTELPLLYWTFRSKYYLWGVFRGKQQPPASNALSSDGEFAEIPLMGKRCDDRSPVGPLNNSCS